MTDCITVEHGGFDFINLLILAVRLSQQIVICSCKTFNSTSESLSMYIVREGYFYVIY